MTFLRVKKLCTPLNTLAVHISVIGLFKLIFSIIISLPAFALAVIECNCKLIYPKWMLAYIFHFSLYPLNIAFISFSYFMTIKYSAKTMNFKAVIASLIFIWVITIIFNTPIVFLVPKNHFVTCCEGLCKNTTVTVCDSHGALTPNLFNIGYFMFLSTFLMFLPCIGTIVFSIISKCTFKPKLKFSQ